MCVISRPPYRCEYEVLDHCMLPPFFLLQSLQNEVVERAPSMDRLEVLMEIISTECKHQFSVCNQVASTYNTLKSLMDDVCMKV